MNPCARCGYRFPGATVAEAASASPPTASDRTKSPPLRQRATSDGGAAAIETYGFLIVLLLTAILAVLVLPGVLSTAQGAYYDIWPCGIGGRLATPTPRPSPTPVPSGMITLPPLPELPDYPRCE